MDIYLVVAICIVVPCIVMGLTYYLLKDLKFSDFEKPKRRRE